MVGEGRSVSIWFILSLPDLSTRSATVPPLQKPELGPVVHAYMDIAHLDIVVGGTVMSPSKSLLGVSRMNTTVGSS